MFDKNLIPSSNSQLNQVLSNLYAHAGVNAEQKAALEKKFEKITHKLQDKIATTVTISQYFDQLWKQPEIKEEDKEYVIRKLEAAKESMKQQIVKAQQDIAKEPANLDVLNAKFQTSPFEDFNYQAKIKDIKKRRRLDIESDLFTNQAKDLDMLYALNRPAKTNLEFDAADALHYTYGLCDPDEEAEINRKIKAEEFVKKIKEDKKAFARKMKQIEENIGNRELEELERIRREREKEEEERLKEKKKHLEDNIKKLNARSEARLKQNLEWEESYKAYLEKKPLFKEMEDKYKKGHTIPELEDRKRRLQEIRDFHKPISKEDLIQHEVKVSKLLEERVAEKKEQQSKWNYQKPSFESNHHKTAAEEISKARRQKDEDFNELVRRKEKITELMQNVKEKHMPKIDHQKELEMMGLVEQLKKRKDNRAWTTAYDSEGADKEHIDPKKLGVEYLKSVREMNEKKKKEKASKEEGEGETEKKEKKQKQNVNELAYATAPVKKHNYLADLRKENKLQSSSNQVDLIIKNKKLDYKERKELLQSEIEKLEEKAKRKEMVKKHKIKRGEEIEDDEDVDQIYINAIRAKLQILGN